MWESIFSNFNWGQLASTVVQTYGAVQQANAQAEQVRAQNAANEANAKAAEAQASSALKAGAAEEQRQMLRTAQLKSDQRAAMAARGLSLEEGSTANVLSSTDFMGEIDRQTIKSNAQQQAWGYREQAANYRNQNLSPSKAAATSLLTDAPSVAKSWLKLKDSYTGGYTAQSYPDIPQSILDA
jgi:hypothetical protein